MPNSGARGTDSRTRRATGFRRGTLRPVRPVAFFALAALLHALAPAASAQSAGDPPVVSNERPVRYVLTGGSAVIGTRIGEDAEYYVVQTAAGPVRIRKADVAYIDFQTAGTAPGPAAAAPAPAPQRRANASNDLGAVLAGIGIAGFAVSYFFTIIVGAFVAIVDEDASYLFVPGAGPLLYYTVADPPKQVLGLLIVDTVLQAGGIAMAITGAVLVGSDDEANAGRRFALAPWITGGDGGDGGGLSLGGRF